MLKFNRLILILAMVMGTWLSASAQIQLNGGGAYASIQDAINDATIPGDVITVPSGTYEGFSVAGKTDITITGNGAGNTVISPSSLISTGIAHKYTANMQAVVFINNSSGVEINGMTIQSNSLTPGAGGPDAIVFWNSSFGDIVNCEITGLYTISGVQTGQGIAVDASNGSPAAINVTNTSITGFQKNGIDAVNGNSLLGNPGTITVNVNNCTITGAGSTSTIAQNGILVWNRGGGIVTASVNGVSLSNINYTPPADKATGILAYGTAGASISSLTASDFSNVEVYIHTHSGEDLVPGDDNVFDGIILGDATDEELFLIEEKIQHKLDDPVWGLVTLKEDNLFVNDDTNFNYALSLAGDGDTIKVKSGTYSAIVINNGITLIGEGGAVINSGSPAITVNATGVTITGFTFNFDAPDYAIDILPGAYDVTIDNCRFENTNGLLVGNGVRNQGTGFVDARFNYWFSSTGPTIVSNPGGTGAVAANISSGSLEYFPWYINQALTVLSVPQAVAPINGLTGVSILPELTWSPVAAVSYRLYVDDAPDFTTPLYETDEGTNLTKIFDALTANFPLDNATLYYWKVGAFDFLGNEYESPVYHFTTIQPLTVTLSWAVDNALIYESPVTFGWFTGTFVNDLKFTLQYKYSDTPPADETFWTGTPADDADPFASVTLTAVTSSQQPVLLTAKQYYWRVLVQSDNDDAYIYYPDYNVYETFKTIGSTTVTIIPSYPTDGAVIYTYTPVLYWYISEYADGLKYQVKYGTSGADVAPADGELDAGTKLPADANIIVDG
ncbi:MAG: hypothetical protein R6W90_18755, partial [Ignavibacteriaceae bacterium]